MASPTVIDVGLFDLATTGQETGQYLLDFQADVARVGNTIAYVAPVAGTPGQTYGSNPFTLAVSAAASKGNTGLGSEGLLPAATNLAVEAGSVNIQVINYTDGFAFASGASGGTVTSNAVGTLIDAFGGGTTIDQGGSNATVAAGGTGNVISLLGTNDHVFLDSGATATISSNDRYYAGHDNTIVLGSQGSDQPSGLSGETDVSVNDGNMIQALDPTGSDYIILQLGGNTVIGTAGSETIAGNLGYDLYNGAGGTASVEFVGATSGNNGTVAGVSTVVTGSGHDVVFAEAGVDYTAGSGNDLYVGGNVAALTATGGAGNPGYSHSTVTGGTGNMTLYGGTIGDQINVAASHDIIVNGGGADTVTSGSVAVTLFGNTGGDDRLVNTASGSFLVAGGGTETIDASAGGPSNAFFLNDAATIGDTTLVGSVAIPAASAFSDLFVVQSIAGAGYHAHTVTFEDFHSGDALFLNGYSNADNESLAMAVAAHPGAGNLAITLSDGTTLAFQGNHPMQTFNGGTVAT